MRGRRPHDEPHIKTARHAEEDVESRVLELVELVRVEEERFIVWGFWLTSKRGLLQLRGEKKTQHLSNTRAERGEIYQEDLPSLDDSAHRIWGAPRP